MGEKKRILAIDYGERRVGVAVSDPMNILARGLPTLDNDDQLFSKIRSLVTEFKVGMILVGMPYTLRGELGLKGKEVGQFVKRLGQEIELPIRTWDERFTSRMARNAMIEMGTTKRQRRRKEKIDEIASTFLLQSYLDSRKE